MTNQLNIHRWRGGQTVLLAVCLLTTPIRAEEPFWMLNTIAFFQGTDGREPQGGLTFGPDGALYGTAVFGGPANRGVIYRVTTNGNLTSLFAFNGTNGSAPGGKLLLASDGNFYGTAQGGRGYNGNIGSGYGTIFRMSPLGEFTTLIEFGGTNGADPSMSLIQAQDGWIYGGLAGRYVGEPPTNYVQNGLLFRCSTNGQWETVHEFGGSDGRWPVGRLLEVAGGFYGTTRGGGAGDFGTAYFLSTNGTLTTLGVFGNTNGAYPVAGLSYGSDGQLYGSTQKGGYGYGTVYRLGSNGITMLKAFTSFEANYVNGTLVPGPDGTLYGTAANGGRPVQGQAEFFGSIYRVFTNGNVEVVLSFNFYNGVSPVAELLPDGANGFYGTTVAGTAGNQMNGSIFHYGPGASPVIQAMRVDAGDGYANFYFDIRALGGVAYGLEMNSEVSPDGWQPVPSSLWYSGPVVPEAAARGARYTDGSLTIQVSGPPIEGQKFFRAVLLKP